MKKIILIVLTLLLVSCENEINNEQAYTLPDLVVVDLETDDENEEVLPSDTETITEVEEVVKDDEVKLIDLTESEILWLQESLKIAGFYTARDGNFGPNTNQQLEAYKRALGLKTDGYTSEDKKTLIKLREEKLARNYGTDLVVLTKDSYIPSEYIPDNLREVKVPKNKYMELPDYVADKVEEMFEAAQVDSLDMYLASAYRSYEYQEGIFSRRVAKNGFEEAETVVAIPGQSEHQTGLAIDITSSAMNFGLDQTFENEPEFTWMMENCYKFGFILSYRKGREDITGYIYEPWHYRYVGDVDLARHIMTEKLTLQEYFEEQ